MSALPTRTEQQRKTPAMTSNRNPHRSDAPTRTGRFVAGVALSIGLVASACGGTVETGFADESVNAVDELNFVDESDAIRVDPNIPVSDPFQFTATDLFGGGAIEGMDLYEGRPTIMTFVVPSCPVCQSEGPLIAQAAERHSDVTFVVVHSAGTEQDYLDFVFASELETENIIHITDTEMALWQRFGVRSQPSTVLVDSEGRLTSSVGALNHDGLDRAVDKLRSDDA